MLILNAADVRTTLPMATVITATQQAYAALSNGQAEIPLRSRLAIPPHNGTSLFMPAYVKTAQSEALAVKIVSLFPGNLAKGLPFIHAAVLVLEAHSGLPLALLEGGTLTAIRTGAASGAATDLLARPDAKTAAIFGAGAQARTQLEAICTVRDIETAWIFDLEPQKAQTLVADLAGKGKICSDLRVAPDPAEAASLADIICTATTSKEPVYPSEAVRPGTHINGVGSYTLDMLENPPEIYRRACAFVDSREAVLAESGETVAAIQRGLLYPEEMAELGEVILGQRPGRTSSEQITFFKSVGVAVQDAIAAQLALQNAIELGCGQVVDW
ncbi:MAG TPA: ornithine cyclodeaminase [Chloroflexi bacterium]|nr:ornithine cyclodeaminase [Chloroflexota bacterium]HBY07514.1 ornithine cyclodeaminase [Chloroflexota bacterium]